MNKKITFLVIYFLISVTGFSQKEEKLSRYFDNPILVDSTGFILIPTRYNTDYLTSNKIVFWNNYYANILFTKSDDSETKRLFEKDTYIKPIEIKGLNYYRSSSYNRNSSSIKNDWIFYLVKNVDSDKNKRIDEDDPTILYITDLNGDGLQRLTPETENVSDYFVYESSNCIMIKMQTDLNKDNEFTSRDKSYYFLVLDLKTLKEIKRIGI